MKVKPLFDRVVLEPTSITPSTSSSGLVLPETSQEKPLIGKVLEVGSGEIVDGQPQAMLIKKGDLVLFSKYAGTEFKLNQKEFIIIRQTDILAVLKD